MMDTKGMDAVLLEKENDMQEGTFPYDKLFKQFR